MELHKLHQATSVNVPVWIRRVDYEAPESIKDLLAWKLWAEQGKE